MRRTVLHTCLVVLVTFLAFANTADQNTITYDNKTSLERTTLKEQQEIHDDVLRHITTTSTTASSSLPSDTSSKSYGTTLNKLLTTPRSINEEEQLQKILEDTDTTTKSNNEEKIQIHEKYERKLTINETGGREADFHSPQLTNKTSTNEVIDVVTYKYNESGPSSSVRSYVTVSHTSSYEHSSSVLHTEDDEDDHTPEYHLVSTAVSKSGRENDENSDEDSDDDIIHDGNINDNDNNNNNSNGNNDGTRSKNYVNNNEESRGLLRGVVPVIDLNTSISNKKYTINNVNNDVTVNNKLRPDALDEQESTTNFSISSSSSSSSSSSRSSISKGIISLENVNSTHSSNGDSVNQSINSIINSNNVNIDEHTTLKPRLRYSVRKSEENVLSNISYNNSDNSGSSTTVPDLIKLDTINTVPVIEWEKIPNVIVTNRTDVNSTTVLSNTAQPEVTQSPSISAIVKPSIAFKNKLRTHPTIRIKTILPTSMESSSELLSNSSNEGTSEEKSSVPLNGKYSINSTIKTTISSRKHPPKFYYLSQSNSSDLTIPPTATAWALASMLDSNSRALKKSPFFTTAKDDLKNDALSEKPITTPAPKVKSFFPWSTETLQKITTESTVSEDAPDKLLHADSESSSTSNADYIQETTLFNTSEENTTQSFSAASSPKDSVLQKVNNNNNSNNDNNNNTTTDIVDNVVANNKVKTDGVETNDQFSVRPYSSVSTTEVTSVTKALVNKSEIEETNSPGSSDVSLEQSSTQSYHSKPVSNSDALSLDNLMTTAQYYGSSENSPPLISPSSPTQNDTKSNVIDKYDFSNNRTETKLVNHDTARNKTDDKLLFDMNQTSNEIRSNDTLKFKTILQSDIVEGEIKSNNTNNIEAAAPATEDPILDIALNVNVDSEEDTKNNETTIIQMLDLPLETTTNTEVVPDEDGDNEDEDLHNIIIKTTTPSEGINHDVNIADFDSSEDAVEDKKLNKDTVEMNEDRISNKNLTSETTEKPSNMDINWYNIIAQGGDEIEKEMNNSTQAKEPATTSEMEHPQPTPVVIITTSSSSTETPTTSTTTTSTVKPATVVDTTTITTTVTTTTTTSSTTAAPTTAATTTTTSTTAPSTTTAHVDESLHIVEDLPAYISLHVETSLFKLCKDRRKLKQAIVDLFRSKSERRISESQVILLNVNKQQCMNVTKSDDDVIPVNILLVDEVGHYDSDLMDKCLQLFKDIENSGFDMYFTVHKIGLVMQGMSPPVTDKGSVIAAITLSFIAAVCLLLLGILLVIIRKRQKGFNYGQRCTPVSLDDYSLDNISVYNSVRRKGAFRASKRSYGNPAFDDPGAPSHSMNFAGLANFSSDIEALHEEFNQIPMITVKADELPPGAETKNRYANVIPLPETRVQLTGKEGCDHLDEYINANFVKGPKGAEKFYIACQAPLQSTVNDFWKMIWQQQCKVILMMTDLQENGVEKCADYLPPCEVLDCHRLFGDFQVTLKKREEREKYVISSLQLKNLETNSWREVVHLWYASWPTQGVPEDCSSIIAFLIEARSFMRSTTGPTVVHCSPGTGRTGTVIAIDICIRDFETTRSVDIPKTVYTIRRDRAGAVQTKDQYTFIYQVLNLYAAKLTGGALDSF